MLFIQETEAQFYLIRILSSGENRDINEALRVGEIFTSGLSEQPLFSSLLYQAALPGWKI